MREEQLTTLDISPQEKSPGQDQHFYGNGKVLISGEYFVLDGVESLALPIKFGQSLSVKYKTSYSPKLYWKSYDVNNQLWFDAQFEFWHFHCQNSSNREIAHDLHLILKEVRKQNTHFLRDDVDVHVETKLGFPLNWGLGSSSSLVYNIAQWADVGPFELLFNTQGGSGFDIACAQSDGPICYQKMPDGPRWRPSNFNPGFRNNLYFVYLGKKQDSREAISFYNKKKRISDNIISKMNEITRSFEMVKTLTDIEYLMRIHEEIVSAELGLANVRKIYFQDYWGEVKSLGAWGGDFILVTSERSENETIKYFKEKGFNICLSYDDLILSPLVENDEYLH